MVKTHGLAHLSLSVKDPEISKRFYESVFGAREYYRDEECIQLLGPGPRDVLSFDKSDEQGKRGGITHFGFRLTRPEDIDLAAAEVVKAGGKILHRGEFNPGQPYIYAQDPDGYEMEIWFEPSVFNEKM